MIICRFDKMSNPRTKTCLVIILYLGSLRTSMILLYPIYTLLLPPFNFLAAGQENTLLSLESTRETTKAPNTNIENVINETTRPAWFKEALNDIAYALRSHKFNSFDVRYQRDGNSAPRTNYKAFPKPPLRSLHWEVHHFCDASFLSCIDYLRRKVRQMSLKKEDDSSVVIFEQKWDRVKDSKQIGQIELECKRMKEIDNTYAPPFEGPLERYQWLTTASYYMCWYTMNEVPDLEHLGERCDNFGQCLDFHFGPTNEDLRADDKKHFGCALYSFCPDPCCANKYLDKIESCWESEEFNPCYSENPVGKRQCELKRNENTEFAELILNHWNVSCNCDKPGFKWSSKYGICVDIDECSLSDKKVCKENGTACINLPGSFRCICKWGYTYDLKSNKCEENKAIQKIKLDSAKKSNAEKSKFKAFMHKVLKLFAKSAGGEIKSDYHFWFLVALNFSRVC